MEFSVIRLYVDCVNNTTLYCLEFKGVCYATFENEFNLRRYIAGFLDALNALDVIYQITDEINHAHVAKNIVTF